MDLPSLHQLFSFKRVMLLIIAHHHDVEAQWLCKTLKEDYNLPVYIIMPEALGIDYSISLHLKNNGQHHSTIFFHAPEARLESNRAWYAINRLSYINPLVWQHTDPVEKAYATNEINAFFPALIHSLTCPVSNSIHNGALYGEGGFAAKWAAHLHQHGVFVHPLVTDITEKLFEKLNTTPAEDIRRLIYFNNELILPPTQKPLKNYISLKRSIIEKGGSETLEFIFLKRGDNDPELLHISKTPSLSLYGKRFTDALFQRIKEANHDNTDGHTQRNTFTAAR